MAETDSAANHYGLPRAENPRHISVFCGPCSAPRIFLGSLDRRMIMSTFDTLPGESNALHHLVNHQLGLPTMRWKNVGIPM